MESKAEYIYIISNDTNAKDNKYKLGYCSGTARALEDRYRTYLQTPRVLLLIQGNKHDEGVLLKLLDKFRVDGSEWVQMELHKLKQIVLKHFLNSAEIVELTVRASHLGIHNKLPAIPEPATVKQVKVPTLSESIIDKFNRTRTTSGAKSTDEFTKSELVALASSLGVSLSSDMTTREIKLIIKNTLATSNKSLADRLIVDVGTPSKQDRNSVVLSPPPNKSFSLWNWK